MAEEQKKPKSYLKIAQTLVVLGAGIFFIERLTLKGDGSGGQPSHIDPTLLSLLVIAPLVLIAAGAIIWMVGRMRRR